VAILISPLFAVLILIAMPIVAAPSAAEPRIDHMAAMTGKERVVYPKIGTDLKIVMGVLIVIAVIIGLQWII
jgi:hypothetical protein